MLVELKKLRPNPMRDFTVDPIDEGVVDMLTQSIKEDGFWGGVVCRQIDNGDIQIAAGHHRISAAMAAGIETADIFVGNGSIDNAAMVRIYARENATQRGNHGTAQVGSVASAVRFIAKEVMTGGVSIKFDTHSLDIIRGQIASDKGVGLRIIVVFLDGVPGINDATVRQALVNLKASGNYARIIAEVQAEIERENEEALKALARAEKEKAEADERDRLAREAKKASDAQAKAARAEAEKKAAELARQRAEAEAKLAAKRRAEADAKMKEFDELRRTRDTAEKATEASARKPVTFDFEGVAKHLKNAHQIDVFRETVTSARIAEMLPVDKQSSLARHLVRLYEERKKENPRIEFTGAFIKDNIVTLMMGAETAARQYTREEKEKLHRDDMVAKARDGLANFVLACRRLQSEGDKIKKLVEAWPKGLNFPADREFRDALLKAKKTIDTLYERT